ncbi:MAG: NupC/NupG family nucleoside CNT transporter [Saprospiraceae bacterium]
MELANNIFRGLLGMTSLICIAWLFSQNRKAISWRLVLSGIGLQFVVALLILKVPGVKEVFDAIARIFIYVVEWSEAGASFLFGKVATKDAPVYIFAYRVLPTVLFYSALSALLFYMGIMQRIVYAIAWILSRSLGLSGPESLAAAANVFIGQTEAPLIIRPYLEKMTKSEIMCLMTGGMATIAGGVFAAFVGYLGGDDPAQQLFFARHLLAASLMSAPAAIVFAKILVPETHSPDLEKLRMTETRIGANVLDAIAVGVSDGLRLAVNVGAMLIVFTGLVYMMNWLMMHTVGDWTGLNETVSRATAGRSAGLTFTYLLGLLFAPLAWLIGTPAQDILLVGELLGQKTVINEFVAYGAVQDLRASGVQMQPKSMLIAVYALCGFSNFASIGIQIGGISALAPGQRGVLTRFGILALVAGSLACFMTAAIAGMIS